MNRISVSAPTLGDLEGKYLAEAYESGWISSTGPFIDRLKDVLPEALGLEEITPVSTGTSALHLALLALDIGPGDEVIVPDLSFVAVPNSVLYVGAKPVFVDVQIDEFGMSTDAVRDAITSKTKAIIIVHNYGFKAPVAEIVDIAHSSGIYVIEDCAEAMFLSVEGAMTGTQSDIATYSFFGNKVITSGEGGAVGSNSKALIERVNFLKNQSAILGRKFVFEETGYNYRMTNLQAAVLCGQLERRQRLLEQRGAIFHAYSSKLSSLTNVSGLPLDKLSRISPWLYHVRVGYQIRDAVISDLAELNVETRPFFQTHSASGRFQGVFSSMYPNANMISAEYLNLPTYAHMSMEEVEYVVEALQHVLSKY